MLKAECGVTIYIYIYIYILKFANDVACNWQTWIYIAVELERLNLADKLNVVFEF